jgi:hypothetical protein
MRLWLLCLGVAWGDVSVPTTHVISDLDGDGVPERISLRCDGDDDDRTPEYRVEYRGRILRLPFEQDGRTVPCNEGLRVEKGRIVHEQTHHHGWHKMFIAIRERRLAVVREEYVDDVTVSPDPEVYDADAHHRWNRLTELPYYGSVYLDD